jgi:hypothetical protein
MSRMIQTTFKSLLAVAATLAIGCSSETFQGRSVLGGGDSADGTVKSDFTTQDLDADRENSGSSNYALTVHLAAERAISPEALASSMAAAYDIPNWRPPRICLASFPTTYPSECAFISRDYCHNGIAALNRFYCDLGGQSRETRSFSNASINAGDLILTLKFATNMCSQTYPDPNGASRTTSETANRFGVVGGKAKLAAAESIVAKFLGLAKEDPAYVAERDYVANTFFFAPGDDQSAIFLNETQVQRDDLTNRFTSACIYLTLHPLQFSY